MNAHTETDTPDVRNASVTAIADQENEHRPLGPDDPRVAFPSAMRLTRPQEKSWCDWLVKRYEELNNELGRSITDTSAGQPGQEWYSGAGSWTQEDQYRRFESFFGKRLILELTYQNRLDWRKGIPKSVFRDSNLTLSTSRRITNQRIARFRRYFFEPRPWWAAQPIGERSDRDFARKLLKIADLKLYESGSDTEFGQAVTRACVIGEAILHIQRAVDDDHYVEEIECLVDVNGKPIVAGDGNYITRDDVWQPLEQMTVAADGTAVEDAGGEMLARDPSTTKRDGYVITPMGSFQASAIVPIVVPRRAVHYEGARSSLVHSRDLLCPLSATSLHTADCIVHIERIPVSEIAQRYAANPSAETIRQAVALIRGALKPTSESDQTNAPSGPRARAPLGEDPTLFSPVSDELNIGHFYCKADPAATGITSDCYCMMDLDSKTPIYYHYTAAASPTRRRPYRVIRESAVDGRWFGQGSMEQFGVASNVIDLFLNRAAITQSQSGRIIGWKPERTLEGQQNPKLRINFGDTVTPTGDWKLEDVLQIAYLEDNKSADLHATLELLNQAITNESGTASANDASAAGLDSQDTATGINNIQDAGNELTSLPVQVLRGGPQDGLTAALDDFVATTFRYMDPDEKFSILDGEVPVELQMTAPELSNLRVNVQIRLTSMNNQQESQQAQQGILVASDFHLKAMTPPQIAAQLMAPLYIKGLQAAGTEDADKIIVVVPMAPPPGGDPAQAGADAPRVPPPEAIPGSETQPPA